MSLRIPGIQIQNVTTAVRPWFVRRWIFLSERSEGANPLAFEMEPKRVVESMTRFMTKDAHTFDVGAAFHFAHEFPFELHQTRMSEIKRNRKSGDAIRSEPFS